MGFAISNVNSAYINSLGFRVNKAKATDVASTDTQKATEQISTRYKVSSNKSEIVGIQKAVSKIQLDSSTIKELESEFKSLERNPAYHQEITDSLKTIAKKLSTSRDYPNKTSNTAVRPVTISEPPKKGHYYLSIKSLNTDPDDISYKITIKGDSNRTKTIETSISPISSLISGVALHFELPLPDSLEIIVSPSGDSQFPIPDLEPFIDNIKNAENKQELEFYSNDFAQLLDNLSKGLKESESNYNKRFNELVMSEHNKESAKSEAIGNINDLMLDSSKISVDLFKGVSAEQIENLLSD